MRASPIRPARPVHRMQRLLALLLGMVLSLTMVGTGAAAQAQLTDAVPAAEGTSVTGRVTDLLSGAPVVGARVWSEDVVGEATTDNDGAYVLPVDEGTYTIRVEAEGYLPGVATDTTVDPPTRDIVVPVEGRTGIDVQLEVQPVLHGLVLSPPTAGSEPLPLPGVVVKAYDAEAEGDAAAVPAATAETGPDGEWVIDELLPGTYLVQFDAAGTDSFSQWWDGAAQRADATAVQLLPGDDRRLDATLRLGASVSGRIIDAGGEPVPGITVRAVNEQNSSMDRYGSTDVNGDFRITHLNAGQYTLLTSDDEYLDTYYGDTTLRREAGWFSVPESAEVTGKDVVVQLGGSITGQVSLPDGGTASVRAVREGTFTSAGWGQTEPDGTYRVGGLESGSYTVQFYGSGLVSQWWDGAATAEEATPVEVTAGETTPGVDAVMEPGEVLHTARLTGGVVSEAGDALPDIAVEARCTPTGGSTVWQSGVTDSAGLFDLAVPAGWCSVDLVDPHGVFVPTSLDSFEVADGETRDLGVATLQQGATVTGTVLRTSTGDPVGEVRVELRAADGFYTLRSVTTDADGRYVLGPLAGGVYQIQVVGAARGMTSSWWPDALEQSGADYLVLAPGDVRTDVDLSIDRVASVTGAVTGVAGDPVEGVRVTLASSSGSTAVTSGADGGFTIGGRAAGDYVLAFDGRHVGYLPEYWQDAPTEAEATSITLSPGQALSGLTAALDPGGTITGRITDAEGQPVVGAQVSVPPLGWASTDDDGRYRIPGLDPGEYTVEVIAPYDDPRPFLSMYWPGVTDEEDAQEIAVSAGSTSTADLVLREGGSISGTVTLTRQAGVRQDPFVTAITTDGQHVGSAAVADDGSYTITGLRNGDYVVSARYAGGLVFWPDAPDATSATPVTISDYSSVDGINLTVPEGAVISGTVDLGEGVAPAMVSLWDVTLRRLVDRTTTDAGGAFSFRPEPGDYVLSAQSFDGTSRLTGWHGGGATWLQAKTVHVSHVGEVVPEIDIELSAAEGETHEVSGLLVAPPGTSPDLAGLYVLLTAVDADGHAFVAPVAADGTFTVQKVTAGRYAVEIRTDGTSAASVVVAGTVEVQVPADGPVEIPVDLAGSVTGSVTTEVGSWINGTVTVTDSAGQRHATETYSGTYIVGGLPAGPATVRVEPAPATGWVATYAGGDHRLASAQTVEIQAGEVAEAPGATIPFGGVVTGTFDGDYTATVVATSPSGEVYSTTWADFGTYRLVGVPDDDVVIEARQPSRQSTWWERASTVDDATPVRVAGGRVLSGVDLLVGEPVVADENATVSGVVLRDGAPFRGVGVSVRPNPPGGVVAHETQEDGTFTLTDVPPGTYRVRAAACLIAIMEGYECAFAQSEPFTVVEGVPTTGVVVSFGEAEEPPADDVPFEVVPLPEVSGEAVVGSTLSVTTDGWVPQPDATEVDWLADGVPVEDATGPELVVGAELVGTMITARVTASAAGRLTTSAESDPVGPVTALPDPDPEPEPEPEPAPVPEVLRTAGPNRYATGAALALANYEPGLEVVYLAAGANFPDALAGAAVAGWGDAPVLLTRDASLPAPTRDALQALQPGRVVLLGGTRVITEDVEQELVAMGITVERVAGDNRYATAALVSGLLDPSETVFVANGLGFPDALAGAAAAGTVGAPVLLTRPARLPDVAVDELLRHDPAEVVVLGGPAVVSDDVVMQIEQLGYQVQRIYGANRYATAAALASWWESGVDETWVASGTGFADALSAAPLAARQDGPILLSRQGSLPAPTGQSLLSLHPGAVHLLGGEDSLSDAVRQSILDLPWGG